MSWSWITTIVFLSALSCAYAQTLSGVVKDGETRAFLPYASIAVSGTAYGTQTDERGYFELDVPVSKGSLIITYTGYRSDTVSFTQNQSKIFVLLFPEANALQEITVISGTLKEVSKMSSPISVEVYSPALFYKNPSPAIFESLGMINGIQPQLNCNVCNTGDIHINGMEGPYTMVLIDGMPIVSSLATVYGLSGIPTAMVKKIEVVKGPASTLYGSEAVAGLINIITKDPLSAPRLQIDAHSTTLGEFNLDMSTKWKSGTTHALLGVNVFDFQNRRDINGDNFTDVTLQKRASFFNKWDFYGQDQKQSSIALRYVYEDRWGGEMQWTPSFRGSDVYYGESIYTHRAEVIGNYRLPAGFSFDYSYNYHHQDSYYGTTKFLADQQVAFAQLKYNKVWGKHDLMFGIPFRYINYDDNTPATAEPTNTWLPSVFVQDEFGLSKSFVVLAGLRYDRHSEHGNIFSPRLSVKWSHTPNHTTRISGGNGFRVVNLFTEDHAALTGSRQVIIANSLKPESSWNVHVNHTATFTTPGGFLNLDGSAFYTYFTNKITADYDTDPEAILYDNLNGYAVSKGISVNAEAGFIFPLKLMAGFTVMDVYQEEKNSNGEELRTPQLFAPAFSGTFSFSYALKNAEWLFDLTGRVNGPMHLPVVPNDFRPEKSPWFTTLNFQCTRIFASGVEGYIGVKNLLNFIPDNPLLRPFDPFDRNTNVDNPYDYTFDTSYNYAPVQGIKFFIGVRYII